jgi:hypothetical protein
MTGKDQISWGEYDMPEPEASSQDATDTLGTDSVTDEIGEQVMHEREIRAREEQAILQEQALREVEEYINRRLANVT